MADDPKISQRYRDLPREEPPRQLDDAILAASRRAVPGKKRQSWYVPLAAAAIIVLAVAVTVHVDRERPDEEVALSQATPPPAAPAAPAEPQPPQPQAQKAMPEQRREFAPDPKPAAPAQDATEALAKRSQDQLARRDAAPPAEAQRQAQEAAVADAQRAEERAKAASESTRAAASAPARPAPQAGAREGLTISAVSPPSPEQVLQGIADLRRQGRHEEADKALAEFRRAFPDYQMSAETRMKVERERAKAR